MKGSTDILTSRRRGPDYGQASAELAPIPSVSHKAFREAFKALQERRARDGKLVIPSKFNPRVR